MNRQKQQKKDKKKCNQEKKLHIPMLGEVFQLFEGYLQGGDKHIGFALLVCFLVMWETAPEDATPKRREGGLWVQLSISKADAFVLKEIHE